MAKYHLLKENRYQIEALKTSLGVRAIAKQLDLSPSIFHENCEETHLRESLQVSSSKKKNHSSPCKGGGRDGFQNKELFKKQWSPEQISVPFNRRNKGKS